MVPASPTHKSLSLFLFALCLAVVASAGYSPGPGWPEVSTPFYHAATTAQATERLTVWVQKQGHLIRTYRDTGSMRPVLKGGRELLVLEVCRPDTELVPGQIVQFNRGDVAAALHYIADVSADGRSLYISGVHNRYSDGWFPREAVSYVVREIITSPEPKLRPPSHLAAVAAPSDDPVTHQP